MNFHILKVKNIKRLTPASVRVDFEIPSELKESYAFTAGQYVTLEIDGVRRDYSLCSSPLSGEWSIGIKEKSEGYISRFINCELKIGDALRVSTPQGRFGIPTKPDEKRTILAFAAGSGITPILSVLKYTLETEEWVSFYLFFSNRTPQDVMFKEEIDKIKEEYPYNFFPYLFYSQHKVGNWLFEGRLDGPKFQLIVNQLVDLNEVDETIVCGPNEMISVITDEVHSSGIPKENIHFELFTVVKDPNAPEEIPTENKELETVEVTVELDGEVSHLTWDTTKNLVDAMVDAGIDAPYSCKGGICSSCMCKIEEGEVTLSENFVLTDSDHEQGIILACCSRPKSKEIRINFDDV